MDCFLIGFGNAGINYDKKNDFKTQQSHFSSVYNCKKIKRIFIFDKNTDLYKKIDLKKKIEKKIIFLKQFPIQMSFSFAIIATTTNSHYPIIKKLTINNNVKNILCEKPFTNQLRNSIDLFSYLKKKKINLYINYQRRYLPVFYSIKKLLKRKKILKIECNYSKGIYENACHFINLFILYFGKPKNIKVFKKSKSLNTFVKADFLMSFEKFYINFKSYSDFYKNKNIIIFYFQNEKIMIRNNQLYYFKIYKKKYRLENKYKKINDQLKENIGNYQYYALNNYLKQKKNYKCIQDAILTLKIMQKVKNEKFAKK